MGEARVSADNALFAYFCKMLDEFMPDIVMGYGGGPLMGAVRDECAQRALLPSKDRLNVVPVGTFIDPQYASGFKVFDSKWPR